MSVRFGQLIRSGGIPGEPQGSAYLNLVGLITKLFGYRKEEFTYEGNRVMETASHYSADPSTVRKIFREYGGRLARRLQYWQPDLDQLLRISDRYDLVEKKYLEVARQSLTKGMELLYKGYCQRGIDLLKAKVFPPLDHLAKYFSAPKSYSEQITPTPKKESGTSIVKVVPMIAILGFFSIFLYSMGPNTTGQAFAISGFNLYVTALFTFITLAALYLIYKM
ncbi:MAG: hypothetical protein V1944_01380 [Candidatus Aenigmatarchaeota archaeon]